MQTKAPDRLEVLRAKYLEDINAHESGIRQLREKLKLLDELQADAAGIPEFAGLPRKYSAWKLTRAVLDAVQIIGGNGGVSASEVKKYVSAQGYIHPNPKNLPVAVVIALTRLVRREKIASTKTDGKRLFMARK